MKPLRCEEERHILITGKSISAIDGRSGRAKFHHPSTIGGDNGERSISAMPRPISMRAPPQGLGKVGGGGLMSGVVGVLARVRRGPAGTMGSA